MLPLYFWIWKPLLSSMPSESFQSSASSSLCLAVSFPHWPLHTRAGWWKSFSPSPKTKLNHLFQRGNFSERKGHHDPLLSQLCRPLLLDRTPSFQSFRRNIQLAPRNYFLSIEVLLAAACKFLETDSNHLKSYKVQVHKRDVTWFGYRLVVA